MVVEEAVMVAARTVMTADDQAVAEESRSDESNGRGSGGCTVPCSFSGRAAGTGAAEAEAVVRAAAESSGEAGD